MRINGRQRYSLIERFCLKLGNIFRGIVYCLMPVFGTFFIAMAVSYSGSPDYFSMLSCGLIGFCCFFVHNKM